MALNPAIVSIEYIPSKYKIKHVKILSVHFPSLHLCFDCVCVCAERYFSALNQADSGSAPLSLSLCVFAT